MNARPLSLHRITLPGRDVAEWAREHGALVVLVLLFVVFTLTATDFFTTSNLRVLVQGVALPALVACGVTVGILAGQFDLSVGGIFGFAGIVAAYVFNEAGMAAAIVAGVLAGVGIGVVNGMLVAWAGIQSFLVTLATGFIVLGLGLLVTHGTGSEPVKDYAAFAALAQGTAGSLQYRVWIVLAIFAATALILNRMSAGRTIFAVGGSEVAARVAGVRTRLVVFSMFLVTGACAGLAGVISTADSGIAQSTGGVGMEFSAITAVIVGGTSILGGRGGVWRTLTGVLLLAIIANGFTLLYVDPTYNGVVQGAIVLAAITFEARVRGAAPA
jgi:ribose transport system permease protein